MAHSGRFLLRIPKSLHAELARQALEEGVSLNQYATALLAGAAAWRRPAMGLPGFFPDHGAERRRDFARTTPGQRVAEAISLSRFATQLAAGAAARR